MPLVAPDDIAGTSACGVVVWALWARLYFSGAYMCKLPRYRRWCVYAGKLRFMSVGLLHFTVRAGVRLSNGSKRRVWRAVQAQRQAYNLGVELELGSHRSKFDAFKETRSKS